MKKNKKLFNNILITGGAGFIGYNLSNKLSKIAKNIIIIDNFSTGFNKKFLKNVKLIIGDCSNKDVYKKIGKIKFDSVIHLAGVSSVEASFDNPEKDARNNIISTINIIEYIKKNNIPNFIFSSSMCIYGNSKIKVNENSKINPISFYGISKLTAEKYINFYKLKNTTKVILRLFNVYGPGTDKKNKKHGMVGIYANQLADSNKILVKGKISRFRDFIHIDDVVKIIINSIKLKNKKCNIFNVCSSKKTSVKELLNKIIKFSKKKNIKIIQKGSTPGDQFGIVGSNKKVKKILKIKRFTNLNEGLKRTLFMWLF